MTGTGGPGSATGEGAFPTTLWSDIKSASAGSPRALKVFLELYWKPVYCYLRRNRFKRHDAEDLTQDFFLRALEKEILRSADRNRGRFRTFLLACLKNFLADRRDRTQARKRGGGVQTVPFNSEDAERELGPAVTVDFDAEFERQWAASVLERALETLRSEVVPEIFAIATQESSTPYRDVGRKLGMTEDTVAQAVRRARRRLRELVEGEVSLSAVSPEEAAEETKEVLRRIRI